LYRKPRRVLPRDCLRCAITENPRNVRNVIIECGGEYGTSCALHLTLFFRRSSAWPSPCSSGADSRAAFNYADKLLKTLLITGSLERNAALGLRWSLASARSVASLLGENREAPRVAMTEMMFSYEKKP